MDENRLKAIVEEVVNRAIEPIKQGLNEVKLKQEESANTVAVRVLPPLTYIETTLKSYADRYVANEDHIQRLDKRLTKVEDNLGIQPPQELNIPSTD